MPRTEYVKGVGYVRAGSWSTKPPIRRWQLSLQWLESAALSIARLDHLFFNTDDDFSKANKEYEEERVIWKLEEIRDVTNALLAKFPKAHRIAALENVTGRTPEEAALFKAKADALRESL